MFQYNRFWHLWFQLDNRHYLRVAFASLISASPFIIAASYFPLFWRLAAALPLVSGGIIAVCTKLSDFFYWRHKNRLARIQRETPDEILKEEIDLYLNRRVVCPKELLQGKRLRFPDDMPIVERAVENDSFTIEPGVMRVIEEAFCNDDPKLEKSICFEDFWVKECSKEDVSSNDAAREMAELFGFEGVIPPKRELSIRTPKGREKFLYAYKLAPNAQEAQKVFGMLYGKDIGIEPNVQEALQIIEMLRRQGIVINAEGREEIFKMRGIEEVLIKPEEDLCPKALRAKAKKIIRKISFLSFQENFLLLLILGVQEGENEGNIFFVNGPNNKVELYNIGHENIMPKDNYNVTKRFIFCNTTDETVAEAKNVFPISLWLAGWPQANRPFLKAILEKTLSFINPERLLAYHRNKKLFSPEAVGSQLERILLIKSLFEEEAKKTKVTLTPKELFLKFINNHPTYTFLNGRSLNVLTKFSLLGTVPEGADMSLLRHPLQWGFMNMLYLKEKISVTFGKPFFLKTDSKSCHACHLYYFEKVLAREERDEENQSAAVTLSQISSPLLLKRSFYYPKDNRDGADKGGFSYRKIAPI